MGVILAKFRKEKSTEAVLEALQEKINTLETFTVSTQEKKKRFVGNFLAISIAVYVIAFVVFYFVYFPPTWKDRIVYCIPLLLFPIIIILLRYLFTWYFQRKLNHNSTKLTALRAEKKKILEQVMDKETYKVAVNLLARYADKPSKAALALSPATPSKPALNRTQPVSNITQRSKQLTLPATPQVRLTSGFLGSPRPQLSSQISATSSPGNALMLNSSVASQQLRRRTPFPIVNQQEKGVFDRIVDVLIGDGPQDRFAMICKECYSHNGMALKDDFEYTTFRCAFCNALNPARKTRPVAPRLSVLPASSAPTASSDSSDSSEYDDKDGSDEEMPVPSNIDTKSSEISSSAVISDSKNTQSALFSATSETEEELAAGATAPNMQPSHSEESTETSELLENSSFEEFIKQLEKSASAAIENASAPPQ